MSAQTRSQLSPQAESERVDLERAKAIIARHQISAPVDVVAIAKEMGVNVYRTGLQPGVSGILRPDSKHGGSSGYVILVNADHPNNRVRFTVAHEIGHFVLHREGNGEIVDDEFYRALPGPLETEANEYAADILMPWSLINQLQGAGVNQLDDMARKLEVSKQALAIRLGLPYDQSWE
jgi:Zn-dependent peptidase ImmA (M78 family)